MPNKPWKQFERHAATLVGGKRYPSNSGHTIDVESAAFVVQCKNVQQCSLGELTDLALEAERQGFQKDKVGMVCIKQRTGRPTPALIVMTEAAFKSMSGPLPTKEA